MPMRGLDLPRSIEEALKEFMLKVHELLGPETRVYLFGSFARGDWLMDSDLDIIVVSRGLEGVPWHKRYPILRRLLPPNVSVDILAYTPEEFEYVRGRSTLIRDAETYWVELG